MTFPDSPRVIYERNPLSEVFALLRFPPILKIDSESPAVFQDSIRAEYPQYADISTRTAFPNVPPQVASLMQGFTSGRSTGARHQFASQDAKWQVTLTREGLELKTTEYRRWEEFHGRLAKLRDALEKVYKPAIYLRVDLRYVDVIQRSLVGLSEVPWSELLKPYIAGELYAPELASGINSASRQLHCKLDGSDCYLTLKTGIRETPPVPQKEQCFYIDSDFHTHKQTEVKNVLDTLNGFNRVSRRFFRWCIEQRLHEALGPKPIEGNGDAG